MRYRRYLLLALSCCMLTGCISITGWLWKRDESTPPLHIETARCEALHVRGQLAASGAPKSRIQVLFTTRQDNLTPYHLRSFDSTTPGVIALQPPDYISEQDWMTLPGAGRFQVESFGFRIFRGDYFAKSAVHARMQFEGVVTAEKVVEQVDPATLDLSHLPAPQPVKATAPSPRNPESGPTPPRTWASSTPGRLELCVSEFDRRHWAPLLGLGHNPSHGYPWALMQGMVVS